LSDTLKDVQEDVINSCMDYSAENDGRCEKTPRDGAALLQVRKVQQRSSPKELAEQLPALLKHLEEPSSGAYNFSEQSNAFKLTQGDNKCGSDLFPSQFGQDRFVDRVMQGRTGLFAIESGAMNGEEFSNTVFLEACRSWHCLLIEPNPVYQEEIHQKGRKCHLIRGALSPTDVSGTLPLLMGGGLSGLNSTYPEDKVDRLSAAVAANNHSDPAFSGAVVQVPTFPLRLAMHALGRDVIDYWSLDVEGAEADVLEKTDFEGIEIGIITVEHNHEGPRRQRILDFLEGQGMVRVAGAGEDDFYVNPAYLQKRGLEMPEIAYDTIVR
jgi:FkbM family methyltransferase